MLGSRGANRGTMCVKKLRLEIPLPKFLFGQLCVACLMKREIDVKVEISILS